MQPKYYKIKENLKSKIENGEYQPNKYFPSETELIQLYGVSRITVRRAIQELVNEEYLFTVQGKGTYVVDKKHSLDLVKLTSCTEDLEKLGYDIDVEVLNESIKSVKDDISRIMSLTGDKIFQLERVYYANNNPINYTITNLNIEIFNGIENIDFRDKSLYKVLNKEYGLDLISAKRKIKAIFADENIAKKLEIEPGSPILKFECKTYGKCKSEEVVFEVYTSWYRTDMFDFYVDQYRN